VGMGTSFTARIPLNLQLQPASNEAIASLDVDRHVEVPTATFLPEPDASEMILIVEDNQDLREYLKNELQHDYRIIEANDGASGIAASIEKLPTLIISDLMMPGTDGLQLCETLKKDERTSHIPIILLTAKADVESRLTGYNRGADDYMAKPFETRELLTRIKNIIENRKRLQAKYIAKGFRPASISVDSVDDRFLRKALNIIEQHMDDTSFGVTEFAKEIGMSSVQLYRKLHALTGYSANDLIRHIRLLRACDLLQQKAGNVADIAYRVGFNNLSYFSKVYKEKFGHSPSEDLK
jgi:DNA-binding response OmpR family regulator